jgi:Lrp/AsnC family leucine-responsive transcriptional regulator
VINVDKMNPNFPKLTENDKVVLRKILDSKRIPDTEIAKTMNLSPQAVFKIRSKLEDCGIIKGYMPIVDFKKIGINVMTILVIRLTSKVWKNFSDDQISDRMSKTPYVVDAYRVADEQASHVLTLGFRDTNQKEQYIAEIQTKFAEEVQIKAIYTFSVDKIKTQNPLGLLHEIVNKRDFSPDDLFLNQSD